jgi:hypothetical protein
MDHAVPALAAKRLDKVVAAQVARNFHELARTSSRTRWSWIAAGGCGWSKK